ncbi:AMP-binding protein [Vibrio sp. PP-XX7]
MTHTRLTELIEYEHTSLTLAQQCSGVSGQTPLFTSLLNYRYAGGNAQIEPSASTSALHDLNVLFSEEQTNYPLTLSVNDHVGEGFSFNMEADSRIGSQRMTDMVLATLQTLVTRLASETITPIHQLNFLPTAERQQVLHDFNGAERHYPTVLCLHQLFEYQAAATPEAIAVIFEQTQLTYQQLNHKANQLAHWLIEQGVRPDSRVAITLDRSAELVIAMMATLKAGGAYVPLDPGYPQERLCYMLEDSAPSC